MDCRDKRVRDFEVVRVNIGDIRNFIEEWHYSKNTNGLSAKYCFALFSDNNLIGAMIYGDISMQGVWKKYAEQKDDVIELKRLCCIDDTPKNTESYFIGKTLRWLKKNTNILTVISYADTTHNHTGVIYKASNFTHIGMTQAGKMISFEEKLYHDKTIRTTYINKDGVKNLKPFAQKIKDALDSGKASFIKTKPKHIYTYKLR